VVLTHIARTGSGSHPPDSDAAGSAVAAAD
jgi:hypothetical protein